jgi:hypothetical protein
MSGAHDIPEEAQQAIKQLSSQHGEDPDDLRQQYTELLEEEADKGVSDPGKRALRRLSLNWKGGQMQSAEQLRGYVLGASDPINTSRSAINRAKNYIEKQGAETAAQKGLVKKVPSGNLPPELAGVTVTRDNGQKEAYAVLDTNQNSPTAGEVLPAEDWIRYAHGAVWRSADDGPHWFSGVLNADDHGHKPRVPPTHEPVSFEAVWVGDSDQNNTIRLRFRDTEPFEPIEQFGGPGVLELLEDDGHLGHVPLEQADADRYDRNDVVATYGSVTYMELAPDGDQSRRLAVVDPFAFGSDLSRTVWLPDHTDVDFAEESDIYVVGQVSPSQNEYPDSIEALGVYPHPDYRVDRSGVQPMDSDGGGDSEAGDNEGGGENPAELGTDLQDPSEVEVETEHDVEFDTGGELDQPDNGGGRRKPPGEDPDAGGGLPPVVEEANYPELQAVAAGVEGVPGSGIAKDEMLDQLLGALGAEQLGRRLIEGASGNGDSASGGDGGTDGADSAGAGEGETDDADASADGGEVVADEDRGEFEPQDEDDSWEW